MKLVDVNLMLYAYDASSELHASARHWVEDTLSGAEPVLLPWATLLGFLRIATSPRVLDRPLTVAEADDAIRTWLEQPCSMVVGPGGQHREILVRLLSESQLRGADVTDAHIAALAIEHGAVLCTHDRGFRRFAGLRYEHPLS